MALDFAVEVIQAVVLEEAQEAFVLLGEVCGRAGKMAGKLT